MNWRVIWRSLTHEDMRKRILIVLGMLLVFRILAHIPVPLPEPESLKQVLENLFTSTSGGDNSSGLLSFLNVFSGGALANFSIMIAGLGPYINASIIMQLLTKAVPKLEALQKEGEYGQKKINQMTRLLTFPLAILQSVGAVYIVKESVQSVGGIGDITATATPIDWVLMVAAITGGSMLLMWLGELITEQGIGNGISLLITVGIVSVLPGTVNQLWHSVFDGTSHWAVLGAWLPINKTGLLYTGMILLAVLIVTWLVVMINEARRKLVVNYAKRVQGNRTYGGVTTVLPVKLITAGVVPIIFAVAFLSVPPFAGKVLQGMDSTRMQELGVNLETWFSPPTAGSFSGGDWQPYIYPVAYFLLVFLFTFFYTSITFNSKEIAENLQKQGGFLEGVRSGHQTEKYLSSVVNRLTLFGAICLGLLALSPIIAQMFMRTSIALEGTSILILVAVALETLRAVESRALMVTYDQYSNDDFFHDMDAGSRTDSKKRRFSLVPFRRAKAKA